MNGTAKPYVVGIWCSDGTKGEHNVGAIAAVNDADASARAVSQYYMRGGKLPLVSMSVMQISEETARSALAMIEADKAMDKTAAEVVKPFRVVPNPMETTSADRQPLPAAEWEPCAACVCRVWCVDQRRCERPQPAAGA